MDNLLATYLNDHFAGATGGLALFQRAAAGQDSAPLRRLSQEVADDRESLRRVLQALGVRVVRTKVAGGWLAEKAMRLKPNGALLRRTPLDDVVELEALTLGVRGKKACWAALRALAESEPRLDAAQLDELLSRAERQHEALQGLHLAAVRTAFS